MKSETQPDKQQMAAWARYIRRRQAREAALGMVKGPRLTARAKLRSESADVVQRDWPIDPFQLEQVLWPVFSDYCLTLLDKIAEVRLAELGSHFLVRRYIHWLHCTCVPAIVDDVCSGMEFSDTAKHIFDVIGDVRWPAQAEQTKRALANMRTEILGGPHSEKLEMRLRALLNGRITHWEGVAEIAVGPKLTQPAVAKLNVDRIRKWITDEGHSNKDLAILLDMSERTVSSLRNNRDLHGQDAVTKLANLMKVEPEDLYLT
jgi:hypothetical protein